MTEEDNHATSLIREWFANDDALRQRWSREGRLYTNVSFLGHDIKAFVYGTRPNLQYPFNEILDSAISDVDWIAVAGDYIPEEDEEKDGTTE